MYSNILLPISFDDNDANQKQLAAAKVLASDGARITLLHAMEVMPAYVVQYVPPDLVAATRDGIQAELDKMAADISGADAVIVQGSPGRAITDWATENTVDLIVMPSHHPGISDVIFGSTAGYVVRHVDCTVHVIR